MDRYFNDELRAVDMESEAVKEAGKMFTDAKDGGNIAEKQQFDNNLDYWKSYELTYSLQNPDNGLPTELYKGLVVATQVGLITDSSDDGNSGIETRWDEAITKVEAIEMLCNALRLDDSIETFSYKLGEMTGYEATKQINENGSYIDESGALVMPSDGDLGVLQPGDEYTIESLEEDLIKYTVAECETRTDPDLDNFEVATNLKPNQKLLITGKVVLPDKSEWYLVSQIDDSEVEKQFITKGVFTTLVDEMPTTATNTQTNNSNNSGNSSTSTDTSSTTSTPEQNTQNNNTNTGNSNNSGTTQLSNGDRVLDDGTVIHPDGSADYPDGRHVEVGDIIQAANEGGGYNIIGGILR